MPVRVEIMDKKKEDAESVEHCQMDCQVILKETCKGDICSKMELSYTADREKSPFIPRFLVIVIFPHIRCRRSLSSLGIASI